MYSQVVLDIFRVGYDVSFLESGEYKINESYLDVLEVQYYYYLDLQKY